MTNLSEIKKRILKHSGHGQNEDTGLLHSLRPYQGFPDRDAQEFIESIIAYSTEVLVTESNQTELIYYLWNACDTIRRIAISTNGPLQRNSILEPEETIRIKHWVNAIEHVCLKWLSGCRAYEIALPYAEYIMNEYPIADKNSAFLCLFDFLNESISQEILHQVECNIPGHFEKMFDVQYTYLLAIEKLENQSKKWIDLLKTLSTSSKSEEMRDESKRIFNLITKQMRHQSTDID